METKKLFRKGIAPIRILPIGFLVVVLVGTALLMLPASSGQGRLSFFDALFTATSASCVTGLVVVDTGTYFSRFGQTVVLVMIQLGGLGFMTVTSFLFSAMGGRISLKDRMNIAEAMGEDGLSGMVKLVRRAVRYTFAIEGVGALLLAIRFVPDFGWGEGLWRAVFHSISAFCNAGFDIIGGYASFTGYVSDPLINLTLMALITLGGLGFAVITDIRTKRSFSRLNVHSKLVLSTYAVLTLCGALLFMLFEYSNPDTLGSLGFFESVQAALFQSVTCRTAGFNTIDQAMLLDASKLLSCVLMFIGGAPAGTAGGIKVTSVALLLLTVRALVKNRTDVEAFGRSVSVHTVRRATGIFLIGFTLVLAAVTCVSLAEGESFAFVDLLFEVVSAIGTVGLTAGVTGAGGTLARAVLCAFMYIGRVGILTLALALGGSGEEQLRYPKGNIMVG